MPRERGNRPAISFDNVNENEKYEIKEDIVYSIFHVSDVLRETNSIVTSRGFHLDAREITDKEHAGKYKVDIQRRYGNKRTVAVVRVDPYARSLFDLRRAMLSSLDDGYIWDVT